MKAIKIKIAGTEFLLPEKEDYEFPTYILAHKHLIEAYVAAGKAWSKDPLNDHFHGLPDASDFRATTGIIGFPFDAHDPNLYAADRQIDVVMAVEL